MIGEPRLPRMRNLPLFTQSRDRKVRLIPKPDAQGMAHWHPDPLEMCNPTFFVPDEHLNIMLACRWTLHCFILTFTTACARPTNYNLALPCGNGLAFCFYRETTLSLFSVNFRSPPCIPFTTPSLSCASTNSAYVLHQFQASLLHQPHNRSSPSAKWK